MMILITYDVNTTTPAGRRRLRQMAKCCEAHGQRVQNSVFECSIDYAQFLQFRQELAEIIDKDADSLRIYNLGNKYQSKVIHMGTKKTPDPNGTLIL